MKLILSIKNLLTNNKNSTCADVKTTNFGKLYKPDVLIRGKK